MNDLVVTTIYMHMQASSAEVSCPSHSEGDCFGFVLCVKRCDRVIDSVTEALSWNLVTSRGNVDLIMTQAPRLVKSMKFTSSIS